MGRRAGVFALIGPGLDPNGILFRSVEEATGCQMLSHQFGWELHLDVDGDVARTVVCRSQDEVLNTQEQWREGLEGKGWMRRARPDH